MQFNLKKYWTWTWKNSDELTRLELTLRYNALQKLLGLPYWTWIEFMIYCTLYIGVGLEKYPDYPNGFGLTLCCIGLGLDKHLDYVTGVGFILLYISLGLIKLLKQGCRLKKMKTLLNYQQKWEISGTNVLIIEVLIKSKRVPGFQTLVKPQKTIKLCWQHNFGVWEYFLVDIFNICFHKIFPYKILYQLTKFQYETFITFPDIKQIRFLLWRIRTSLYSDFPINWAMASLRKKGKRKKQENLNISKTKG